MKNINGKNKVEDLKAKVQEVEKGINELSEDKLDQVSGAGNPFEDIPRVPTQPIDDELRKKA